MLISYFSVGSSLLVTKERHFSDSSKYFFEGKASYHWTYVAVVVTLPLKTIMLWHSYTKSILDGKKPSYFNMFKGSKWKDELSLFGCVRVHVLSTYL